MKVTGRLSAMVKAAVVNRPKQILMLLAVMVGLLATQLPQFSLDASSDSLLLESDSGIQFYRAVRARYGGDDYLIVTWNPAGGLFSDQELGELGELRDELASLESVESVVSILDVPLLRSPPLSTDQLSGGAPTLLDERTDRGLAEKELKTSPLYANRLMSDDGGTTALQVNLVTSEAWARLSRRQAELREQRLGDGLDADERRELRGVERRLDQLLEQEQARTMRTVGAVRDVLDGYRDRAEIHMGGVPMINADMIRFIRHDLVVFGVGLVIALAALLALVFRQLRWVVLPLASCAATVVTMMGLLALAGWAVTVVSSNFISLMLILTLSLNVHLVVRYRELHNLKPEADQRELVMGTIENKFAPSLYTALTTMVAFGSLVISDIRPVIDFGWMMVLGMAVAFSLTFLILPASLALIPPGKTPSISHYTNRITGCFTKLIRRLPKTTLAVYGLVTVASAAGILQLSVDNRFIDYFKSDTAIHQGMKIIDEKLGGTTPLDIVIDADPEFLKNQESANQALAMLGDAGFAATSYWYNTARLPTIDKAHDYVNSLDDVGKVLSLATSAEILRQFTGDDSLDNIQLSVMYKRLPDDVHEQLIEPYLSEDGQQTRIAARVYETSDTLERDALLETIRDYLINELGIAPERVHLTGLMVLYNNVLQSLLGSQASTAAAVAIAVFLMFAVSFRSLRVAALALVPTVVSAAFVLGLMSALGVPLDVMTITIAAIAVGIGVDDTIHYVYRFQEEFAETDDYDLTIERCHSSIGHAMYYTSVIIILGFSILALSSFVPTIYFGLLTGLAMLVALVANMTLLPLLFSTLEVMAEPPSAAREDA